jgi:hypothetical protein
MARALRVEQESGYNVRPDGLPSFPDSSTHVHINWHFDSDGKTHNVSGKGETAQQAVLYATENAYITLTVE